MGGEQVGIPSERDFVGYPKVNAFADLPSAVAFAGKIYLVLTTTGTWFVNRKRKGLWRSDGAVWTRMGIAPSKDDMGLGTTDNVEFGTLKLGASALIKWLSGVLTIQTDEGTNTDTYLDIKGKGTGIGYIRIYDEDNAEFLEIKSVGGHAFLRTVGSSPGTFNLQHYTAQDIKFWSALPAGNPWFHLFGYKTAVGLKWFKLRVNADGDAVVEAEQDLIIPNLAGVGDRAVMADVNGKLSAP